MVRLQHIFIVHLQLVASFLGTCALRFITEQNKTTEVFVGTNQTFSWNLSLESGETSRKLTFTFGLWDSSHYTVTYYLATVTRAPSGNEIVTRTKDHSIGSRLYWVGDVTHDVFVAFSLINIQHSDERQYGIIIRVDGAPPDDYQKSFKLLVKDPPLLPTKAPEPKNATIEIIEGESLNITCQGHEEPNSLVVWYKDGHQIQSSKNKMFHISNVSRSQAGSYNCFIQAPTRNHTSSTTTVNVLYAPDILLPTNRVALKLFKGNSTTLKCYASSNPPPTFTWHRGNSEVTEGYISTANSSVLQVTVRDDKDFTRYHCTARNRVGWNAVMFVLIDAGTPKVSTITTQHPTHSSTLESPAQPKETYHSGNEGQRLTMYLSVAAVLAVFVIGFFLLHQYLTKRCRRQDFEVGVTNNLPLQMLGPDFDHDAASFTSVNQAFSENLEVPRENLNIEKVIGCGAFGVVSRAFALNLPNKPGWTLVAVKSIGDDASEKEKRDLLSEMCVLQTLDPHPHVIQLYGYVTSEERPLVLVEYAPHGDLLGYLRKSRGVQDNYYSDPSVKPHTSITSKGLLKFSWEICDGMAYLSSKKIIHRDLAARNVLVGESEECKITDFGMARDVRQEDIYVRTTERRLPIKWTAPEAFLGSGSYTTASDVWSFGVVLYEIFTVGCDPFPGAYMRDIPELLNNGYRMPRPSFISQTLYSIMMDCWMDAPAHRPSFQQLRSILGKMLEDEQQEYVNLKEIFYENVMPSMRSY